MSAERAESAGRHAVGAESRGEQVAAELDQRMAKAKLGELGWRDRDDITDLMQDLQRLAQSDWPRAANLWEKHRPGEVDKPVFIDGDDIPERSPGRVPRSRGESQRDSGGPEAEESRDTKDAVPDTVRRRYLQVGGKFYFRDKDDAIAFEEKQRSVSTQHATPEVVGAMLAMAEAKQWTSIKVRGSEAFRREAWLQASVKGLQVQGYAPRDVDLARLADVRAEESRAADRSGRGSLGVVPKAPLARTADIGRGAEPAERAPKLTEQQAIAVNALKTVLRARGDSEAAVAMTANVIAHRLSSDRVYVGQLVEHGRAPYDRNPANGPSYYVRIHAETGDRVVWGLDLERAVRDAKAKLGDEIVLSQQATARQGARSNSGLSSADSNAAHRNLWDVTRLDDARESTRQRLRAQESRAQQHEPVVHIYDAKAPRGDQKRSAPDARRTRHAEKERS